jgi:Family of unknown function (DUF6353)
VKVQRVVNAVRKTLTNNSSVILSSVAIAGVVTTAYLAGKATIQASQDVQLHEEDNGTPEDLKDRWKGRVAVSWRHYIPTAASGVVTIGCIVGSTHISARRGAAAQAAFILTERAYHDYRSAVIEEIGERKDKAIRDEIAEKKVKNTPPPVTLISGPGNVLCCELHTGRYFTSDMESLRRALNDMNQRLLKHDVVSMEDWYDMIGLSPTQFSGETGWHSDKLVELDFTTVLTEDGRPCLAFTYNYVRPLYGGLFP